ncbi:hypothetical protein, partial [Paraburkholderia megapolitana]
MTSTGKRCEARLELKQLVGMAEVRDEEEIPIDDLLKKYPTDPGVVALYGRYYRTCHVTQKSSILGIYGVMLRWFGFSGFVIFQRVRRPTYPQDI